MHSCKSYSTSVLFFDEARFGTHTKIGYGWFKKGKRTPVKVKIDLSFETE
jgi:hypothetical protein